MISQNVSHYLFVGGDGSLHHGGNLLLHHAGSDHTALVMGVLPCGTGNDWVRTFGVPKNKLAEALLKPKPKPLPLLRLTWPDGKSRYAFNMVGGALDAAVVDSLNTQRWQIPGFIKYPLGLIKTLLKPHTWYGSVTVDGEKKEGAWLSIQAGFGKYCGGGMYVLPHADTDHDEAALLLMRPKSLLRLMISLPHLYNGKIIHQREAVSLHFSKIEIDHIEKTIPLEADGEFLGTTPVTITTAHHMLMRIS